MRCRVCKFFKGENILCPIKNLKVLSGYSCATGRLADIITWELGEEYERYTPVIIYFNNGQWEKYDIYKGISGRYWIVDQNKADAIDLFDNMTGKEFCDIHDIRIEKDTDFPEMSYENILNVLSALQTHSLSFRLMP